jgi:hypothetical protein
MPQIILGAGLVIFVSLLVFGELFGDVVFGDVPLRRGLVIFFVIMVIVIFAMVLIDIGSEPKREPKIPSPPGFTNEVLSNREHR